jgi:hypothetical protein
VSSRLVPILLAIASCLGSPTDPGPLEGRRALFIGNSYLYTQNIPEMVEALADSAHGDKIATAMVAGPNLALIDHWGSGPAREAIAQGGWEWVILQQGPSSVGVNRDTLRLATTYFAGVIAGVNAKPALFSAWPGEDRRQDFPAAIESYTLAAQDVDGILLPIAAAWMAAWQRDPTLQLYQDGLHPTPQGAYLSALVIYAVLLEKSPVGLPAKFKLRGGTTINIGSAAATLQAAAADAVQAVGH